eukprot:TRINITY_DN69295_c0_g1_i1.p1 TRINITY_DN69295_c0_g1~~TRINITY_DN69295_c0_g1_i1.p1  ORF type:complete len:267 (-),score=20.44 TRINITY_DN69295_c0_g1_i1:490-1290(-)
MSVFSCLGREYVARDGSVFRMVNGEWEKNIAPHKSSQAPLAIGWKDFDFKFDQGEFRVNNKALYLNIPSATEAQKSRAPEQQSHGDTGRFIWDASVVLAKFLELSGRELIRGRHVLELGSGSGLVGLSTWALGARYVALTDQAYCLARLKSNAVSNRAIVKVAELDWVKPLESAFFQDSNHLWEVVVAADVVWVDELVEPFVNTLTLLRDRSRSGLDILLALQQRTTRVEHLLFQLLGERNFSWSPMQFDHPRYGCSGKIKIFKLS